MMSLETRINGNLIGCAYVVNEIPVEEKENLYFYSVEYHRIGKQPSVLNFSVIHNKDEGVEKLSLIIYKELMERINLKKRSQNKK